MSNYPIRVLHVVTQMGRAGLENFIMNQYRSINREKVQFDFLVHLPEKGAFDDEIEQLGGRIYKMFPLRPQKYFTYRSSLKLFFQNHPEYKIIHSHLNAGSAIVLDVAKTMQIPIRIAHSHNTSNNGRFNFFKEILRRRLINFSTTNYACSVEAGKWLFGAQADFSVINNSIETTKFKFNKEIRNKIREHIGANESETIIGHVGRFSNQKNHQFLIEIYAEYKKIDNNSRLLLIGDGELKSSILAQIDRLGLKDSVLFTGIIENTNEYFNAMDLFVFPSIHEGLPVTLVEAQCNGLPIIITDSLSKEINSTNLVNRLSLNDPKEKWAEECQRILQQSKTNNRNNYYRQLAERGYDVDATAQKMELFYINQHKKLL